MRNYTRVSIPLKSGRFVIEFQAQMKQVESFNPLKIGSVCNKFDTQEEQLAAFQSP